LLRALRDGEEHPLRGDAKFRWLALGAVPAYLAVMYLPLSATFFQLQPLSIWHWLIVAVVVGPAYALTVASDRWRLA
jgi:hypothetical protein